MTRISGGLIQTATITGNNIAANTISATNIRNDVNIGGPKISSLTYADDDTAANPAGGETITINGSGFLTGATVLLESVSVGSVTVVNANTITFTSPAKATGSYIVYVVNTDGSTAILVPGIQYSGVPSWTTAAGSLGSAYETTPIATSVIATGDAPLSYNVISGTLPTGSTLSSNGQLSGTAPVDGSSTTYTFTVRASDAQNQETDRQFSITINTDAVTWSAPANNATITTYEYVAISNTFVSSSAAGYNVTYAANTLPANVSISGSVLSGTPNTAGNITSLITATANTTGRTSTRTLNFVVQPDAVTWSSPANNTTYTWVLNSANTLSLSATSAAGFNVSYAANSLPTGLSISGSTLSGTPTVSGNSSSLITATAATTGRTSTLTLNWVLMLAGDSYWKNTTLLLSANTSTQVRPFINDASLNNSQLTIAGNTKPKNFSPYQGGYYSYYFATKTNYVSLPTSTSISTFTGNFTIECWVYPTDTSIENVIFDSRTSGSSAAPWLVALVSYSSGWNLRFFDGTSYDSSGSRIQPNVWTHIALVRVGSTVTFYINGVASGTFTKSGTITGGSNPWIGGKDNGLAGYGTVGYISNFRIVNGTAVYTSNFTPSTTPLTAIANTTLLVASSNRYLDLSPINTTLTNSNTTISPAYPFPTPTSNTTFTSLGSAYFDGTSDYLTMPDSGSLQLGSGDFTAEGWFNPLSTRTGTVVCFYSKGVNTTGGIIFGVSSDYVFCRYSGQTDLFYGSGTGSNSGRWVHVAWVRSGSTLTIYRDGVSVASATVSFDQNDTSVLYFGSIPSVTLASNRYGGYISDFRTVKGTALYTSNFTPPTAPLTAVANTQLLTVQYNGVSNNTVFVDESASTNNVLTRYGNVTQGTFSPYGDNWSNYFDGTGDYLSIPNTSGFQFGTGDFTVECWVNKPAAVNGALLDCRASATTLPWALYVDASNYPYFYDGTVYTSTVAIVNNSWNHIAVVRISGVLKIFVNGVQGYSAALAGALNATGPMLIGGTAAYSTGYISNVRVVKGTAVYTGAFTPPTSPLTAIANTSLLTCADNRFIDESPNNFTVTRNGDVSVQKFSPFSSVPVPKYYSAYFDGTGDYLSLTGTSAIQFGSGDFTIEGWIYTSSTNAGTFYGDRSGANFSGMVISIIGSKVTLLMSQGGSWNINTYSVTTGSSITLNAWNHIAITRSGTTIYVFINGVQSYTSTFSGTLAQSSTVRIGAEAGDTAAFTGYVSNFRMVKGTALYTSAFTPSTSPLTAISGTGLLTCQNNTFKDNSSNAYTITGNGDAKPLLVSPFTPTAGDALSYSPTTFGGSYYFDGSGDYIRVSADANISGTGYSWTIQGWVYPLTTTGGIIDGWNGGAGSSMLLRLSGGNLEFYITGGSNIGVSGLTAGRWYHFAIVKNVNNSNTITLYLNGVKVGTPIANYTTSVTSNIFGIGGSTSTANPGSEGLTGYISDLQIIKGGALYTSNFYPGPTPATPTVNDGTNIHSSTLLLSGKNGGIIDTTRTLNFETVGDAKVVKFSPYSGSYYSNYFNGSSLLSLSAGLVNWNADFTIEFWINTTSGSGAQSIGSAWNGVFGSGSFTIWHDGGSIQMLHANSSGTNQGPFIQTAGSLVNDGTWHHVAITQVTGSPKTFRIFVDGVLRAYKTETTWTDVGTSTFNISYDSATYTRYFTGYLSNYRILSNVPAGYSTSSSTTGTSVFTPSTTPLTAISGTSFLSLQSNKFIDNSSNARTITPSGVLVKNQNPFQHNDGQSYYFDGTGDYLLGSTSSPLHNFGTSDFTIECWAYFNAVPSSQNVLLSNYQSTSSGWTLSAESSVFKFRAAGDTIVATGATTIIAGVWYHVLLSRSGTSLKLFVNGTQDATATNSTDIALNSTVLNVGRLPNGTGYLSGYIADARITKGYARYTSAFTPPTEPHLVK